MKTFVQVCSGLLLFTCVSFAQAVPPPQTDLIKRLAKEACQEIKQVDFSQKTEDEMKLALGLPLVTVFGRHQDELKAAGYNLLDPKSSEKLGNDVGVQLVFECPDFMSTMVKNSKVITDIAQRNKPSSSGTISGTLMNIAGGDFSYLQVADDKGKIEKLWWMEYFDGANLLIGNPQNRLNKPIKVRFVEKEMFNSTLKDYVKIKVITGIE
jgi:hypothetical protein